MKLRFREAAIVACLLYAVTLGDGIVQPPATATAQAPVRQVPPYRQPEAGAADDGLSPPSGILGPQKVAPGKLATFTIVDAPENSTCSWVGPDATADGVTDRKGVHHFFLASLKPGECSIVAIVGWVQDGEAVQTRLIHKLTIGDAPDEDDDGGDNPPPPPKPSVNLSDVVVSLAAKLPPSAKVQSRTLAQSFRRAIQDSKDGLAAPSALNTAISTRNTEICGDQASVWRETVWVPLSSSFKALFDDGKLQTPEHYQTAWEQVAAGLDRVFAAGPGVSK